MTDYFHLNGTLILSQHCHIPATDRSYLLGDGLFETILVKNGQPAYLPEHLDRLRASCTAFAYKTPTTEELSTAIRSVIAANSLEIGSVRLTLSPWESNGLLAKFNSPLNILVTFRYGEPYAAALYQRGFTAIVAKSTRRNEHSPLSRYKTTNFLDNILAKKEAQTLNADEAIMLNTAGNIAEGTVTNIFLVKNGQVLTPCIEDGALPGIMRQKVLERCHTQNIPAQAKSLTLKDLENAHEAFLTNSLMGIMPLAKVNDYLFEPTKTSVTKALAKDINSTFPT